MSSVLRQARFATVLLLSLLIVGYAVYVYGFMPLGRVVIPDMRVTFESHRLAIYLHIFASAVALGLGPLQFSTRLRRRLPGLHRWMGRLYLGIGVLIGGLAGLFMAFHAFGGALSQLGFGTLAVVWLYTGCRAYLYIRARDIDSHRRWMIRNFALTFAAVTLRLWLPLLQAGGMPFAIAYPIVAWLCWTPNLVLAELMLNPRAARKPAALDPVGG